MAGSEIILKLGIKKARGAMTEHRCAWCGEAATDAGGGRHNNRYTCGGGTGPSGECYGAGHIRDGWMVQLRTRDTSGENGPETWVDPSQAPAEVRARWGDACQFSEGGAPLPEQIGGHVEIAPSPPAFKVGDRVVHEEYGLATVDAVHSQNEIGLNVDSPPPHLVDGGFTTYAKRLSPAPAAEPGDDVPQPVVHINLNESFIDQIQRTHEMRMKGGAPQWVPKDRRIWGVDEVPTPAPTPQHTHTAVFEFEDGRRVEVPEPGKGWREACVQGLGYPHVYVEDCHADNETAADWFSDGYRTREIRHLAARIWWKDMAPEIEDAPARIVSVTRWEREPVRVDAPDHYRPAYQILNQRLNGCASKNDPSPEWPDEGRPRRVIQGVK